MSQILATANGGVTSDYLRDDGGSLLASVTSGTRTWYSTDNQGSVRQTLDGSATVFATQSYDPYGSPETSGQVGIFGYTGKLQDGSTNAEYLRARWCQPATGTLLGVDPLLDATGNAYAWANNDLIDRNGPTELCRGAPFTNKCWLRGANDIRDAVVTFGIDVDERGIARAIALVNQATGDALCAVVVHTLLVEPAGRADDPPPAPVRASILRVDRTPATIRLAPQRQTTCRPATCRQV